MITVSSSEVAGYLKTANRMIGRVIPVHGMTRLQATDDNLTVSTCNEGGMYSAAIPCDVKDGFDILIDARKILAIMTNCTGPITISVVDYWVSITGAGVKYNIYSTGTEEWPTIKAPGDSVDVTNNAIAAMLHAIAPVRGANNDMRAHIAGFLVDAKDGLLRFTSTDSSRLHSATGTDGYTGGRVIASKSAIPALQQIHGIKSMAIGKTYMVVEGEREMLTVRLLEGSFPVIDDMLTAYQQEGYQKVTFDRSDMVEALDRAAVLTDTGVMLSFAPGNLKVHATNPDSGEFAAEIKTDGDVEADVNINLRYVSDAMHLSEDENVSLYLKSGETPILIVDETVAVVIMPMRI